MSLIAGRQFWILKVNKEIRKETIILTVFFYCTDSLLI